MREYPSEAFYHAGKGGCLIDVTKPPFNAKGDGVSDDTAALRAALRFVRNNFRIETTPMRFTDGQLADFVREHTAAGRMVTFNVLIDKRGRFSPHLKELRKAFKSAINVRCL